MGVRNQASSLRVSGRSAAVKPRPTADGAVGATQGVQEDGRLGGIAIVEEHPGAKGAVALEPSAVLGAQGARQK